MNTGMKELSINDLAQVSGGNILAEKADIRNLIKLNPIGAIKNLFSTYEARQHNQLEIYKAAVQNGFEEKNVYPFP